MKRFCQECGTEAATDHKICIHCGTKLPVEKVVKPKSMTKGQKLIGGIIGLVIVLVIGFSMWANAYHSPESVQKRFATAVSKKDDKAIRKLLIHEDGSAVSNIEAKAFLKLIKQEGKSAVSEWVTVVQSGKFLGIYDAHKMEAVDQFAYYDWVVDGLTFQFNGKKISEYTRDKKEVVYGPLAPGVYDVKAEFKGKYGSTTKKGTLTLGSSEREFTWIDMDLSISNVVFSIENEEILDAFDTFILVNDEKIPVNKDGETKEIGPFLLDGSQKVQTVSNLPWGETISEPIPIDSEYMSIRSAILSKGQLSQVTDTLKTFGEEYPKVLATKSTKAFTTVEAKFKDQFAEDAFLDEQFYSGSFEELQVDESSIRFIEDDGKQGIVIQAQYLFNEDVHELSETPELEEVDRESLVELYLDGESKQWLISSWSYAGGWGDYENAPVLKGSGTLHGPNKDVISKAKASQLNMEMEEFVVNYARLSVDAINSRDFSYVEDVITKEGPRRKEASDYIEYLDSKDITEELLSIELESVESVDETTYKVTTIEEFEIYKPDTSNIKKFRTTIVVKRIEDELLVHELLSTKEI